MTVTQDATVGARLRAVMLINREHFEGSYRGEMTYLGTQGGAHLWKCNGRVFEVDLVLDKVIEIEVKT